MEEVTDLWHLLSAGGGVRAFVRLALMIQLSTVLYTFIQYVRFGSLFSPPCEHATLMYVHRLEPASYKCEVWIWKKKKKISLAACIQLPHLALHYSHICFNLFSHLFPSSASPTPLQTLSAFPPSSFMLHFWREIWSLTRPGRREDDHLLRYFDALKRDIK